MYDVIVVPPAERFIKRLKKDGQKRLLNAIDELGENPRLGKELVGRLSGLRSRRTGNYRIIHKVEDIKLFVIVLRAGYRRDIYSKKFGK